MSDDESVYLLASWKQGDTNAADKLFERYLTRLIALARSRLSLKLRTRVDPEDVVQSVYRVFFDRAAQDEFVLKRSGDLWQLLAAITIKKIHANIEFHRAQKRDFTNDVSMDGDTSEILIPVELVSHDPGPDESMALMEEMQSVLAGLEPLPRQILELRLQGFNVEEIAVEISRSARTVRRALEQTRKIMEDRLLGS